MLRPSATGVRESGALKLVLNSFRLPAPVTGGRPPTASPDSKDPILITSEALPEKLVFGVMRNDSKACCRVGSPGAAASNTST